MFRKREINTDLLDLKESINNSINNKSYISLNDEHK